MIQPFLNGFALGFSLILAIGAQNIFVLRQGLLREHVFFVAFFCSFSDTILICLGVSGVSLLITEQIKSLETILFLFAALWLFFYGIIRLISALKREQELIYDLERAGTLTSTLIIAAVLTYTNPHVYLDTVVLIGAVSIQYNSALQKFYYAFGASTASFVFFFCLAYGARFFAPIMAHSISWKILDVLIGITMFFLAFMILRSGGLV